MSESTAFKNWINKDVVNTMAQQISFAYPNFDQKKFSAVSAKLMPLELKARVQIITQHLRDGLPQDYLQAITIIQKVIHSNTLKGFELWPFSEYIAQYGLEHFDESLNIMYDLTQRFTAEFCVRPFFIKNHKYVLKHFHSLTKDKNAHIRRWLSEGSRPLLPWGSRIDAFKKDPMLTLPLLEKLKYDHELYVRKSVANHLNDISKHHPEVVISTLTTWLKACPKKHLDNLEWIKRHALRTLIKKGHPKALQLMGVRGKAAVSVGTIGLNQKSFGLGDVVDFSFTLNSTSNKSQKLVVDYLIYFTKKNGSTSPKVFKLKTFDLVPNAKIRIAKKHSLKKITTMVYYPGTYKLAIQINGLVVKTSSFEFK
jgi:3-methyladenine DNA glycosylase AlkC